MTAEVLREAAALMREDADREYVLREGDPYYEVSALPDGSPISEMGAYEMRWHPAVALAVADWLDSAASMGDCAGEPIYDAALAVARAYLGSDA